MTTSVQQGNGNREIPDAIGYAIGHRIRVEILAVLHEYRSASATELRRIVHQPLSTVTHHIDELLKSGSIRIERTEKVRSVKQRFYSVVNPLYRSDEDVADMPEEERREICRVILQSLVAEALCSLWAGTLTSDPRQFLSWAWFNVDAQGRDEISDEQLRSWRRLDEIEKAAATRCAENGEEPFSVVVSSLSFERARTAPGPPPRPAEYDRRPTGLDQE